MRMVHYSKRAINSYTYVDRLLITNTEKLEYVLLEILGANTCSNIFTENGVERLKHSGRDTQR
jgi:hypothetical protein